MAARAPGRPGRSSVDIISAGQPTGWRSYLKALGPGLVTGASDDDPSGVATYSQAGAQFGLGLLWVSLLTLPLMAGVQEICDRTALATGRGLGELAATKFTHRARPILVALLGALIVANALNIAADLVAVGSGMTLLHAGPTWMWALVAGLVITALVTLGSFARVAQIFKFLCLALFTYFAVLFSVQVNWGNVGLHTVVPHLTFSSTGLPRVSRTVGPRKVRVQPEASSGAWLHHEGSSIRSSRTSCVVK
jgi:Mn2+/Fe2+ NRAMP family transporter